MSETMKFAAECEKSWQKPNQQRALLARSGSMISSIGYLSAIFSQKLIFQKIYGEWIIG